MLPLRKFQAEMTAYLASAPGPDVPAALRGLLPPGAARPDKRFAVYKNNVYARLVETLQEIFPAVERLVGEDFFRYAAVEYIARTPPATTSLVAYGKAFPAFLASFPPVAELAYLSDVARLELFYLEAYHAADAEAADAAALEGDEARPVLHPSARLMTSPFQVSRIWELNRSETDFDAVALPQRPEYLLVVRPRREVDVRRISLGLFAAMLAFAGGLCLSEAREQARWAEPDCDFDSHYAALVRGETFAARTAKRSPVS